MSDTLPDSGIIVLENHAHLLRLCAERKIQAPAALGAPDGKESEIRTVRFQDVLRNRHYFWDVDYGGVGSDGSPMNLRLRSNISGAGAISLAVVDGKIVFIRQWRAALGRYTWEVPRGFSNDWDSGTETTSATLPKGLKTALRKAAEEVGTEKCSIVPYFLGEVAENSGTVVGSPAYWLLEMKGFEPDSPNVRLVTLDEAINQAEDNHTCAALILYKRHLLSHVR